MDTEQQEHLRNLRAGYRKRLYVLELQASTTGYSTPAEIQIEIDELKQKIAELNKQLGEETALEVPRMPAADLSTPPTMRVEEQGREKQPTQSNQTSGDAHWLKPWYFYLALVVLLASLIGNGLLLTRNPPEDAKTFCDKVAITATPSQVSMNAPLGKTDNGTSIPIDYELIAPSESGVRILFNLSQLQVYNGPTPQVFAEGQHFEHNNLHASAGQKVAIPGDGVYLDDDDLNGAKAYGSTIITDHKIFNLVSDKGIFCEVPVDVKITVNEPTSNGTTEPS